MAARQGEILDKVKAAAALIAGEGFRVERVFLFGSFASGLDRETSDIDAAFVSPDFDPASVQEWTRLLKICNSVDPRIEPVFFHPDAFREEDPLTWEILRRGVEVHWDRVA